MRKGEKEGVAIGTGEAIAPPGSIAGKMFIFLRANFASLAAAKGLMSANTPALRAGARPLRTACDYKRIRRYYALGDSGSHCGQSQRETLLCPGRRRIPAYMPMGGVEVLCNDLVAPVCCPGGACRVP